MKYRTLLITLATGAGAAALLVWAFTPRPLPVETAIAVRGPFETTIDEDARTRLFDRYAVTAPIAARVQRITLREGDPVKAGQVVAVLRPAAPPLPDERTLAEQRVQVEIAEAGLARARTRVDAARVALERATSELRRSEQLGREGFLSPSRLDADRLAAQAARRDLDTALENEHVSSHELDQARAALPSAGTARSESAAGGRGIELRAPAAGRVLRVHQVSETSVTPGTALLDIGDVSRLRIVAELLTTDALQAAPGSAVRIERWGGPQVLQGRVERVEPGAFTKVSALGVEEQRVNVIIEITTPPTQWTALGDGYRVAVRIVTRSHSDVLKVPVSAVFPRAGAAPGEAAHAVFLLRDGRARLHPVRMEARNSTEAWIREGLDAGAEVIVYPPAATRDGLRVRRR